MSTFFSRSGSSPTQSVNFHGAALLAPIRIRPTPLIGQTPSVNLNEDEIDELTYLALEDDGKPSSAYSGKARTHTHIDHFNEMKQHVDTDDPFIFANVVAPRGYTTRVTPTWAKDKVKIQQVLLSAFPRMYEASEVGRRQRDDAGRWAAVINFYFRLKYTSSQVADELCPLNTCRVRGIIQAIQRKVKAIESGNARPRGRPAKNPIVVQVL